MVDSYRLMAGCLVLCAFGCKSNEEKFRAGVDEVEKVHHAALSKRLAQLVAVQGVAKGHPALSPLAVPSPVLHGVDKLDVLVIGEDTKLDDPDGKLTPGGCGPKHLQGEAFALSTGYRPSWGPGDGIAPDKGAFDAIAHELELAEAVPYALVCRQLSATAPVEQADHKFTGGAYTGECRLFALDGAAYLGGIAITEQMVMVNDVSLDGALGKQIFATIERAMKPIGETGNTFFDCSWKS